jgi:phage shock protein PspC (stress-responsive transcriptional regulator)
MKKTLTINLAGMVYHIDEDAFQKLKKYLEALERKFRQEPDVKELIADIEARIAELLNERMGNRKQVVTLDDVTAIITILGDPEVISEGENNFHYTEPTSTKRTYRRMYRDPDNRIIGGVCTGLAAYWNMDPTILRVAFIVLVMVGGSGLLIYLILWIIMPEAQTTAQKLEMRGEAVTIDNIKDFIRDEFEQVKKNFKNDKK